MADRPLIPTPLKDHLRRTLLSGLLFLVPMVVTVWVLYTLFTAIDALLGRVITDLTGYHIPGLGLLATLILVYLIGLVASNVAGKRLIGLWDTAMTRVPLVRGVYKVTKEVSQAFSREKRPFRQVVIVEFPRAGLYTLGFVTAQVPGDVRVPPGSVYVFIPTTPNPTSGWLIVVPESEIHPTPYTVDEGMRVIISAGIVGPPERGAPSAP